MAVSSKTIKRWKEELEINERLLNTKSERFRWLRSLYVRVYQFLLSRYDDEVWPTPTQEDNRNGGDGDHSRTMPFVDLTVDHRGLAARTPQSLRYVLEQIKSNHPAPASTNTGEQGRSRTLEWVVIATSQDYQLSSCEIVLKGQNIRFRKNAFWFYRALEVRFEDCNAAFALLRNHPQKALRWSKRNRGATLHSREFTLFLLLAILVTALCFFFIVIVTTWALTIPAAESWRQFQAPPRLPPALEADIGIPGHTRAALHTFFSHYPSSSGPM